MMTPLSLKAVAYVEDVPEDAANFVAQFKKAGFANPVVIFDRGEMLLQVYPMVPFELILVDLTLVNAIDDVRFMQGPDIVRAIRKIDRMVTVVAVTRSRDEVVAKHVRLAGADGIVSKPFSVQDLRDRLVEAGFQTKLERRSDTDGVTS